MELYHNDMSTCAQKVRLVLREKHLAPTLHHLNLRTGEQNTVAYRKLNPNGVVPTLIDHGQVIVESTVICEYLDDAYPTPALRPTDPLQRARMRWWTMQPDAGFHHAVGTTCVAVAFRHQILSKGPDVVAQLIAARTDPAIRERFRGLLELGVQAPDVPAAVRRYDHFIGQMAEQLGRTAWLAGEAFSLADIMAVPYVVRLEHLSYDWWWTDAARGRLAVSAWLQRCKARPSYAAIADYLDADYLELLPRVGKEVRPAIEAILAGVNG
jgi:glutathione S-transferase